MSDGAFVVLVGPDGVGKTSVASALLARRDGRYFHFRPPLGGKWAVPTPGETQAPSQPSRAGTVVSALRLAKAMVLFWLGYLVSVRPEVRSGRIVVGDRWAYGYLVHPRKLGVRDAPVLATALVRLMPQPDAVFALTADPVTIHARKPELTTEGAAAEVAAWASLPISQLTVVDADAPVEQVTDEILRHLDQARSKR